MYALPALTITASEVVGAQFGPYEPAEAAPEPGHRLDGVRTALAVALERAARAIAPRRPGPPRLAVWRG